MNRNLQFLASFQLRCFVFLVAVGVFSSAVFALSPGAPSDGDSRNMDGEYLSANELNQIYELYIDAFLAREARDATRQLEILHGIARRRPHSGYVHTRIAEVLLAEDRAEEGLQEAQEAVRLSPDSFETHQVLGQAYFQSNDIVHAATEFERALELRPYDYTSLLYLGEIYEMAGEYLDAATVNLRLAYLRPNQAWQHHYKAAVNFKDAGELGKAADMLERVLRVNPSHHDAFFLLAKLYEQLEHWPDAIRIYKDIIRRFRLPDAIAKAHVHLSDIYYRLGQSEEAEAELKWVVENRPTFLAARRYLGMIRYYKGDYDLAIELLTPWVEKFPDQVGDVYHLARAHQKRAEALKTENDVAGAAEDASAAAHWFEKILDLVPDHTGALVELRSVLPPERIGEVMERYDAAIASITESTGEEALSVQNTLRLALLYASKAEAAKESGQDEVAELASESRKHARSLYLKVLEEDPGNAAALEALAVMYQGVEDWDNARTCYERLVAAEPEDAIILYQLGLCELQLREYESAEGRFRTALEHGRGDALRSILYYYLGISELFQQNYAAAEESFREGMELGEDGLDFMQQLTSALVRQQKFSEAESLLKEILEQRPADPEISIRLAFVYDQQKKVAEAIGVLEEALQKYPDNIDLQIRVAAAYGESGETEKAESTLESLIKQHPKNEEIYLQLAWLFEKQKAIDRVEQVIRRLLEVNGQSAAAYNFLGYTYADHNVKLDEAYELISKALAIDPENGMYVDSLGWVYYRQGKYLDAVRELRRAVELLGEDPVILEHLGDALHAVNKTDEALTYWQKSLELDPKNEELKKKIDSAKQARQ